MAMLACKLPLIIAPGKLYSEWANRGRVGESKYAVTGDPYLQIAKGSRDRPTLKFLDPYISGKVQATNFKFGN